MGPSTVLMKARLPLLLLLASSLLHLATGACPNLCSGRGDCLYNNNCECYSGYTGPDCSQIYCPSGTSWVNYASATNIAHTQAECSNMGICDRSSGVCACRAGFTGAACEKSICPKGCNGNGVCMSISDFASYVDNDNYFTSTTYTGVWDYKSIYGCVCDRGYHGYDCSIAYCPTGDDPITTGQVNAVQTLSCSCPSSCSGTFTLSFRGETTVPIPYSASVYVVQAYLQALSTVNPVTVSFSSGTTVCGTGGSSVTTTITFISNPGALPVLQYTSSLSSTGGVVSISTATTRVGTTENAECNNRGTCLTGGICVCDTGFSSSNGQGNYTGNFADCGYITVPPTSCPGATPCSGQGTCGANYKCTCYEGYTGHDCSLLLCPTGKAWFDKASATDTAHALAECSNNGICNRGLGQCVCNSGFAGEACERLYCPNSCSGSGRCYSLKELGILGYGDNPTYTYGTDPNSVYTWDANLIYGCRCDAPKEIYLNQVGYAGGYQGYDCSQRICPTGDDPLFQRSSLAVQSITCNMTSGSFTLTFRGSTTSSIAYNANAATIAAALEELDTIGTVSVATTYMGSPVSTACSSNGVNIGITFLSEFGSLPTLTGTSTVPGLTITVMRAGNKFNYECSNRGICSRVNGTCSCFKGYTSSDGYGNWGTRNDCGFPTTLFN